MSEYSLYHVYILANKHGTVLYVGVTSELRVRIYKHKTKEYKGFTAKYNADRLVYFEEFDDIEAAINREKQIKAGSRQKKIELIESMNPEWKDLYEGLD